MLKGVKKGIKKKIKGKKDKKGEDDLFDPEQLEKYKRELEEAKKARQQDEAGSGAAGASGGHEEDEEWLRFKQLTSGVDVLVNKASTDLEKIKESSFFQRNKPSEQNKLFASERPVGAIIPDREKAQAQEEEVAEGEENHEQEEEEHKVPGEEEVVGEDVVDGFKVPDSPDIEPVEIDDSLFDTTFVEAVELGDIKLAYIPDSPTEEEGDDPFDTSAVAAVVKKIEEDEKRAKRQVNLGDAVEVLTGKADKTGIARPRVKAAEMKAKARPRPHAINLLGDFEDGAAPCAPPVSKPGAGGEVEKPKDLFDQLLDSPTKDAASPLLEKVDLMAAVKEKSTKKAEQASSPNKDDKGIKDVISEFDIISQLDPIAGSGEPEPLPSGVPSSIPSSIAALLTTTTANNDPEEDELDDEFAALAAESIQKHQPLPGEEEVVDEEDPFDTTFVEKAAPHGKKELEILENEFVGEVKSSGASKTAAGDDDDDFDFDPRAGEEPPKNLQIQNAPKMNPLEDLSPVAAKAPTIQPQVKSAGPSLVETEGGKEGAASEDVDPFDTSRLETVLPGKAELKLLEAELLSAVEQKVEPPKLPEKIVSAIIKNQQTVDDDFDFDPRQGEVKHHVLDLHDPSHQAFDTISKILTPQEEKDPLEIDPFDTSAVAASGLIPGALELKLLEDELVSPIKESGPIMPPAAPPQKMTRTFSDEDFDPRGGVPAPVLPPQPPATTEDIYDSTMDFAVDKPLTPQQEIAPQVAPEPMLCPSSDDPFDTSGIQIENYLAKSELKQVEEELLNTPAQPPPSRTLPVIVGVELKKPQPVYMPTHAPPEPPPAPHILEAMTPNEDSIKPLTPTEALGAMSGVISVFNPVPSTADPFDTSIAEGVIPGKTEIKLLEEELGVGAAIPRSLSDDEFDPRGPNHPSSQLASKPLCPVPLQPQLTPKKVVEPQPAPVDAEIDPFDTSAVVADTVAPGRAELKALEAELL